MSLKCTYLSGIPCECGKSPGKDHVKIVGSVNKTFDPPEMFIARRTGWGPRPIEQHERPISCDQLGRYKWYSSRTQTNVESVRAHTNMGNDLWAQQGCCVL